MSKRVFAFISCIVCFYGCTKPLKEIPPVPIITAENISAIPGFSIQKIDFTKNNATIVFGDSWSDYIFNPNNYIKMFADTSEQVIFNKAEIGLGSANMVAKAFETMGTHNKTNIIALSGFNDVRFTGATNELLNFQRNAFTALLVNQFIDTWKPAGEANRTGGTFTSFDQSLDIHFKSHYSTGRKAAYTSSTTGVYLEYDFTGTNVGVSFVGQDTTAIESYDHPHGRWRVLIDGVVIDTPAIHQQAQGHIPAYMAPQTIFPFIKIYSGLSNSNHVLRLEPVERGNKFVDFIFTLRDPSLVSPVVIMTVPYMTEAGYGIDPFADKANDAAVDQVNQAITDVKDQFIAIDPAYSKKIKLINTSDYFDRNTDYLPDLIHPNMSGKINLFKALKKNISY
jgi:hypothetical protein